MNDPHHRVQRLAEELGITVERTPGGYIVPDEPGPMPPADAAFHLQTVKAERWRLTDQWKQAA